MAGSTEFLTYAESAGANVLTQAEYASNPAQLVGVSSGIASSALYNKAQRQGALGTAAISNYMAAVLQVAVLDNGDLAGFVTQLWQALLGGSYFIDSGTASALLTANPAAPLGLTFPAPIAGLRVTVKAAFACAGATTLNWMGTGNKAVQYNDGSALQDGDYAAGALLDLEYDGAEWRLLSMPPGAVTRLANAAGMQLLFVEGSPGVYSLTVPANTYLLFGQCNGAGGGGAGTGTSFSGGGGGAGGFAADNFAVTPGQVIPITVGAGGDGGAVGADGGNGGSSSIGSFVSATGGGGGVSTASAAGGGPGNGSLSNRWATYAGFGGDGSATPSGVAGDGGASYYGGGTRGSTIPVVAAASSGAGGGGGYNGGAGSPGMPGIAVVFG